MLGAVLFRSEVFVPNKLIQLRPLVFGCGDSDKFGRFRMLNHEPFQSRAKMVPFSRECSQANGDRELRIIEFELDFSAEGIWAGLVGTEV
jgi:hypothetical protein